VTPKGCHPEAKPKDPMGFFATLRMTSSMSPPLAPPPRQSSGHAYKGGGFGENMKDVVAVVTYREPIGEHYFRLGLKVGWDTFMPGQFVMVDIPGHEVFLRRPFGIVTLEQGVLEICFKVVGKGTAALSKVNHGDCISVLGPLGNGFTPPKDIGKGVLVAGGYGIAPLFSLARNLINEGKDVILYYGAKKSADLLYCSNLTSLGVVLKLATEDGSEGYKGLVTDLLREEIVDLNGGAIFSAGPHGLLEETARIASSAKMTAQVSLERYMACGMGVCLGCAVKLRDQTYVRACREGPVFDAESILWD